MNCKPLLLLAFLLHFAQFTVGQTAPRGAYNWDNTPLRDAFAEIERTEGITFYYLEQWLDTMTVSGGFEGSLEIILDGLLNPTRLNHLLLEDRVIITYNAPIQAELAPDFFSAAPDDKEEIAGYVFQREYESTTAARTSNVIEVGRKKDFVLGGTSTMVGVVRALATDEPVVGALVYVDEPFTAATTDASGFYALSLPNGKHLIRAQYTGLENISQELVLFSDGTYNITMDEGVIPLDEVVIASDRDANVRQVTMGVDRIDMEAVSSAPKVLGETDIIRIATTLPGVQTIGEGASGFYVRGGGADQNLILLDGAPVYNASHFLGFFSAFNSDALSSSDLYKSNLPAEFGGRLSSVLDIKSKSGNTEKFTAEGGISPVTTRLTLETPVWQDKASVLLGMRTTYSNWLLNQVPDENIQNSDASFLDGILKIDVAATEKDQITATGYFSRDQFNLSNDSLFSYQNRNVSLNWQHNFSPNLNSRLTAYRSHYLYDITFDGLPENAFDFGFDILEQGGKIDFDLFINDMNSIKFGGEAKLFNVNPGSISPADSLSIIASETIDEERGVETAFYASHSWDINDRLSLSTGLRYSFFSALGPRDVFRYADGVPRSEATIIDTVSVARGKSLANYHGPEVRFSARYSLNSTTSVKFSAGNTRQYIHLLSNTNAISPTDTWKLSDSFVRPQRAQQVSLGYYRNFPVQDLETSVEAYYKLYQDLLDYKIGSELLLNETLEADILQGRGRSYGVEFLVRKRTGRLNGWLSYAYARSLIEIEGNFSSERINNGEFFPTNWDQPHSVNLIGNYDITRRYGISVNFSYRQGRPITFPVGQFQLRDINIIQYSDRNQFRIPDYIRLDLALNIEGSHKIKKLAHSYWTFSVYNVFGRDNVYSIFFVNEPEGLQGYTLSIFADPIPSITYNFRF
ncbi:MAG: carboxypeptidase-like regulatory domain-containing protein [Bacteroidota bacterium]